MPSANHRNAPVGERGLRRRPRTAYFRSDRVVVISSFDGTRPAKVGALARSTEALGPASDVVPDRGGQRVPQALVGLPFEGTSVRGKRLQIVDGRHHRNAAIVEAE